MEHHDGTNTFHISKDKRQVEKDIITKLAEVIDSKVNKSTNKSQQKWVSKELFNKYSSLGETFVDTDHAN